MLSEKNWFIRTLIETEQFSVGWWWWLNYKYILYLKFTWPNMTYFHVHICLATYLSKLWQTQMGISCDENAHRNACRMFRDGALAFCGPAGARNFITSTRTMLQRNIRLSSMEVQTRASNMLLYGVSSIQHLRMIKRSIFVFVTSHVEGQMFGELIYFQSGDLSSICRHMSTTFPTVKTITRGWHSKRPTRNTVEKHRSWLYTKHLTIFEHSYKIQSPFTNYIVRRVCLCDFSHMPVGRFATPSNVNVCVWGFPAACCFWLAQPSGRLAHTN